MEDENQTSFDESAQRPVARWVPAIVVLSAVGGFFALAWYAYHAGTQAVREDDLMVVEADKAPVKEKPLDPGGMQFPNQDKTVFETFSSSSPQSKVERVVPAPEEPMPKPADTPDTTTWVNKKLHPDATGDGQPEQVIGDGHATEDTTTVAAVQDEKPASIDSSIGSYTKPAAPEATPTPTPAPVTPAPVVEAPAAAPTPVVTPPATKPTAKTTKTGGSAKVQLGAYRSDKEARAAFVAMQKKFPPLRDKTPTIVQADLGAKGVYYRLRVGGLAGASEAKALCAGLTAKGQACILPTGN